MELKVDLQCPRCYKKVKKVLCKFPQIQDQVYNEEENLVIITVVYCCPESIKQKKISKGGGAIKSIEIKEPEKPKLAKPKKPEGKPDKPKPTEPKKPKDDKPNDKPAKMPEQESYPTPAPPLPHFPPWPPAPPRPYFPPLPPASDEPFDLRIVGYGRIWQGYEFPGRSSTPEQAPWIPRTAHSIRTFGGCSEGPCYEGYGRPVYDSYGGGYGSDSYVSRGDSYSEENPTGCTVM